MSLHNLTHRHYGLGKEGTGEFQFCKSRLPARISRERVAFQPDFTGARWWGVPAHVFEDGEHLVDKMLCADTAHHAMALLRQAYEEQA